MGGTSTDVCHYRGEFERTYDAQFAGVRIRTPMLHVHTVAAGGGSILHFDGARMRVGPGSAGADPGPACYGRQGPLTVTDANVVVGKIDAEYFPQVFGASGNEPLQTDESRNGFRQLTEEINRASASGERSVEQVAHGFIEIAIDNMVAPSTNRGSAPSVIIIVPRRHWRQSAP